MYESFAFVYFFSIFVSGNITDVRRWRGMFPLLLAGEIVRSLVNNKFNNGEKP